MTNRHAWPETAQVEQAGEAFRIHRHEGPYRFTDLYDETGGIRPGWFEAFHGPTDGQTPSDVDSAPDGVAKPAETITGDWDKKEPIINCRDAMLLAVGAGVVLAAAVFVTLLAAMGWVG